MDQNGGVAVAAGVREATRVDSRETSVRPPRLAPELYLNRELGQLAFTRRVLAQAENKSYPLLERLKFLCIVSSDLDEFFEIRVAGLHAEIEAGAPPVGPDRTRPDLLF